MGAGSALEPAASPLALTIGVLVGLLAAGRATNLLLLPIAVWWTHATSREFRRAATLSVAVIVGASAVILPITVQKLPRVEGELIPLTYNGGYNFLHRVQCRRDGELCRSDRDVQRRPRSRASRRHGWRWPHLPGSANWGTSEPNQSSAEWRRRAMDWIREHPHQALRLAARKVVMMWNKARILPARQSPRCPIGDRALWLARTGIVAFLGALGIAGLFALRGVPRGCGVGLPWLCHAGGGIVLRDRPVSPSSRTCDRDRRRSVPQRGPGHAMGAAETKRTLARRDSDRGCWDHATPCAWIRQDPRGVGCSGKYRRRLPRPWRRVHGPALLH